MPVRTTHSSSSPPPVTPGLSRDLVAAVGEGGWERGRGGGSGGAMQRCRFGQGGTARVAERGIGIEGGAAGRTSGSKVSTTALAKARVFAVLGRARRTKHGARPPAPWPARLSAGFRVTQSCAKVTALSTRRHLVPVRNGTADDDHRGHGGARIIVTLGAQPMKSARATPT